jgi:hypothetical protein
LSSFGWDVVRGDTATREGTPATRQLYRRLGAGRQGLRTMRAGMYSARRMRRDVTSVPNPARPE